MKQLLTMISLFLVMFLILPTGTDAQIVSDTLTIQEIQTVHPDSLAIGITDSPYVGDTITVTGVVYAAARAETSGSTLCALGNSFTIYIMDENGGAWSGLNVRATDSTASDAILITAVDTGFVVRVTGVIAQYYSTTQFEIGIAGGGLWNADVIVEVLDDLGSRPDPTEINIADLVSGGPQDDLPEAQQWEGAYVVINDATVGSVTKNTSTGRYTWTILDGAGNSIGVYDQSVYFRGGSQGLNPDWSPPAPGTTLSSIRGVLTSSGQGIVISPLYPGDIQLGSFPPIVSNLTRDTDFPKSTDVVTVLCEVEDSNPDGSITAVTLVYGIGDDELGSVAMSYDAGTKVAAEQIPAQADGSVVWYYIIATDNDNETVVFPGDIISGKPFYIVRDGDLRIRDVQYTPFTNGISGAIGGECSLRGTVVAGADDLGMVFIQDDTAPWSGIMVRGDETVRGLVTGQDVMVHGTIEERFDVTSISDATLADDYGVVALPAPVMLETGDFESDVVSNGNPDAEKWEGMLTIFETVEVTSDNPDDPNGDYGEILVDDGSGDMRIDDIGTWADVYTNDPDDTSKTYLAVGTTIESVTGISYYAFGDYKLEPRTEADLVNVKAAEFPPVISDLARDIGIPAASQAVTVTCMVEDSNEGGVIQSVKLHYGTGADPIEWIDMNYDAGTMTATVAVPPMPDGSVVWYYITAMDDDSESASYPEDLTGPRPFFIVRDGDTRIRDIQYTPYDDGASGSDGFADITTRGVVTFSNRSTHYIQDAAEPWSGIQIYNSDLEGFVLGDEVTVIGEVDERYGVTQLKDVVIVENHGAGAMPASQELATSVFENDVVPDGDMAAEPFESVLLKFMNLTITSSNADAAAGKNYGEFLVSDGSGDMRVDDAGTWGDVYTTDSTDTGLIFLKAGSTLDALTGVMYYAFGDWKLEPRDEDDFENLVTSIEYIASMPADFVLHQNYPNPFASGANTTISFELPTSASVNLVVYDALGRQVATLASGDYTAGTYNLRFNSAGLTAGMYIYRLIVGNTAAAGTMLITK